MKNYLKEIKPAVICLLVFTIICGVFYTGAITGIAQLFFKDKANGSILTVTLKDGSKKEIGSTLIGQVFTNPKYFIGRPQGVSNLSPVSDEQKAKVAERIKWWHELDPSNTNPIPADLVTASASGVDPNISPEAAFYQASRIAKARNISEDQVKIIIEKYTINRLWGFWGEPYVNVLKMNLALDSLL